MIECKVCKRAYTWAEFLALDPPRAGSKQEVDDGVFAEIRNCPCGGTMARLPPDVAQRNEEVNYSYGRCHGCGTAAQRLCCVEGVCESCGESDEIQRWHRCVEGIVTERCEHCNEAAGEIRGDGLEDLGLVCDDCWEELMKEGMVLPDDEGGWSLHDEVQPHPFMVGRYTDRALEILFAGRPSDRTSAGTVRVLERGQGAGKLGIKALIETTYVSRFAALEPPEPWEDAGVYDLPGMFELTEKTGSNDKVWRSILAEVETLLSKGKWVALVANPVQWAYEVRVFTRDGE